MVGGKIIGTDMALFKWVKSLKNHQLIGVGVATKAKKEGALRIKKIAFEGNDVEGGRLVEEVSGRRVFSVP